MFWPHFPKIKHLPFLDKVAICLLFCSETYSYVCTIFDLPQNAHLNEAVKGRFGEEKVRRIYLIGGSHRRLTSESTHFLIFLGTTAKLESIDLQAKITNIISKNGRLFRSTDWTAPIKKTSFVASCLAPMYFRMVPQGGQDRQHGTVRVTTAGSCCQAEERN